MMNFRSRLFNRSSSKRVSRTPRGKRKLSLEKMEDRRLMAVIDLATLTADQGMKFVGNAVYGGFSTNAGDMNGDGYDEVIVGGRSSAAYLVFGRATPLGTVDLSNLGATGMVINGGNDSTPGLVSSVEDINGDGFDDLAIGFTQRDPLLGRSEYKTFVIFGKANLPNTIDLNNLGSGGITISPGIGAFGLSNVGDINGDGFADLFGSPDSSFSRVGYLIFGGTALPTTLSLNALGTAGVTIFGEFFGARLGSARGAGDVNGDGFDDLVMGDDLNNFLIFGSSSLPESLELDNLGTAGVKILGPKIDVAGPTGYSNLKPSGAGDMNGDGFDDLLFMAFRKEPGAYPGIATSFVVFGKASLAGVVNLSNPTEYAVKILGDLADSGYMDRLGDVNADGFDDISTGTLGDNSVGNVIFGGAAMPATINLASLGAAGIKILPINNTGVSDIVDAGDVNGDGFDDLHVRANVRYSERRESYVVFGGNDFTSSVTRLGNATPNTLTGTAAADVMVGKQGDDSLLGNGGPDVLIGAQGNDLIVVNDLNFKRVAGGSGNDTLQFVGSGLNIDLTDFRYNRIDGIETLDITGNGDNALLLNHVRALQMSDTTNTLVVRGNLGDRLNFASGWTQRANQLVNGETFKVFTQGKATLKVQFDIVVNQSPVIAAFAGRSTAIQNSAAILLDSDATVTDGDSTNFGSGTLTVEIVENAESSDRLRIRSFGNVLGQIGVTGSTVKYGGVPIGTFTNTITSKLVVELNSAATPQATQALLRSLSFSTVASSTLDRVIRVTLTDGNRGVGQASKSVRVTANNVAPQLASFGPALALNFPNQSAAVFVAPTATVTDADTTDFNNAKLTLATSTNADSFDVLSIDNGISACCNADGPSILYRGVIVGSESGGTGSKPLVITFNSNATVTVVQDILRNVKWQSVPPFGYAPNAGTRIVTATFTDGDGGTSNLVSKEVSLTVAKLPPVIYRLGQTQQYLIGSSGVLLASRAYITGSYANTSFNGGKLTIANTLNGEATDKFFFRPQGNGLGQINVVGSTITYGGIAIGTFTGGDGLTPLVVTFNANASELSVGATLRRLAWRSTSASPSVNPRTFSVTVTDGEGTASRTLLKQIVLV